MKTIFCLPTSALFIIYWLKKNNFQAYLVGGVVRDLYIYHFNDLTKLKEIDYDFTTNAKPTEILSVFPNSFYENSFGTVSLNPQSLYTNIIDNDFEMAKDFFENFAHQLTKPFFIFDQHLKLHQSLQNQKADTLLTIDKEHLPNYEITTFRDKEVYGDFRRPNSLVWGCTITDDLKRRDFTINALALDIDIDFLAKIFSQKKLPSLITIDSDNYNLIDQHQSLQDLQNRLIRTVGSADDRFREDALRMMRAIRLASQLDFKLEKETLQSIKDNYLLIQHISGERIRDEFLKMLVSNYATEAILLLAETKMLNYILPELLLTRQVAQSGHHTTDVWQHSLDSLKFCPSKDPIVKLASLVHDLGKVETQKKVGEKYTFYGHEIIGANLAYQIGKRLKLSRKDCIRLSTLVRYHMFHYQKFQTDSAIRRFMNKVKLVNLNDIFAVREADRLGSNAKQSSWRLEEMKERIQAQLYQPLSLKDLCLNGDDLIKKLGLKPSPLIGKILDQLMEKVLDDEKLNQKEILLKLASEMIEKKVS